MHIEDYGGETFLSEYVATSLLQEFNQALDRCCTVFIIYILRYNLLLRLLITVKQLFNYVL